MDSNRTPFAAEMPADLRSLLQQAADLQGRELSDFVLASAEKEAKAVLASHEPIRLNRAESERFAELLLNPPPPNEALRRAVDDYRQRVSSDLDA